MWQDLQSDKTKSHEASKAINNLEAGLKLVNDEGSELELIGDDDGVCRLQFFADQKSATAASITTILIKRPALIILIRQPALTHQ